MPRYLISVGRLPIIDDGHSDLLEEAERAILHHAAERRVQLKNPACATRLPGGLVHLRIDGYFILEAGSYEEALGIVSRMDSVRRCDPVDCDVWTEGNSNEP